MRAAPALSLFVHDRAAAAPFALPLGALAGAAFAAWIGAHLDPEEATAALLAAAGAALGALGAWLALRRPPLRLAWDGQAWTLAEGPLPPRVGAVTLAIDLEAWLLVRFVPAQGRGSRWIALARPGLEASWHALRCALQASRGAGSPGDHDPA